MTVDGRGGADVVTAGDGNQTFNLGEGDSTLKIADAPYDYIVDDGGNRSNRTLIFGPGITAANVVVTQSADGSGLVLSIDEGRETVNLNSDLMFEGGLPEVHFQDGTIWSATSLLDRSIASGAASGAATIFGDWEDNILTAGSTDVTLEGGLGSDTLIAGSGNDTLIGATDYYSNLYYSDTYKVSATSGNTTIVENASIDFVNDPANTITDTLRFGPGISPADISVTQSPDGHAILLANATIGKTVTLDGVMTNPRLTIKFDDGTIWTPAEVWEMSAAGAITAGAPVVYGNSVDNNLVAGDADVTLIGGGGNDTFTSGLGNDVFKGSDGAVTDVYNIAAETTSVQIVNADRAWPTTNRLVYEAGTDPADILVRQAANGCDLILVNAQSGQVVTLKDQIAPANAPYGTSYSGSTDSVAFSDGTIWTAADLLTKSIAQAALDGNPVVYGSAGDDRFVGGTGNTIFYGNGGNDTFVAGEGNDTLVGSGGIETYEIGPGAGPTTILNQSGYGVPATLAFQAGISAADVGVTQSEDGHDLILSVAGGNSIVLKGQLDPSNLGTGTPISSVTFSDGTIWSAEDILDQSIDAARSAGAPILYGDSNDNTIDAGDGNVTVIGHGGNDTLIAGVGDQSLIGGDGYTTYVVGAADGNFVVGPASLGGFGELDIHGIDPSSVEVSAASNMNDIVLSVGGSSQTITLLDMDSPNPQAISTINFDDGTKWSGWDLLSQLPSPWGNGQILVSSFGSTMAATIDVGSAQDSDGNYTASGIVQFADNDFGSDYAYDRGVVDVTGDLPPGGDVSAITSGFNIDRIGQEGNMSNFSWSYAGPADAFDYLTDGQSITIRDRFEIDNDVGDSGFATVSVTIEKLAGSGQTQAIVRRSANNYAEVPFEVDGTSGADTLTGRDQPGLLFGAAGDDTIVAGRSGDVLDGGADDDTLYGGDGSDVFRFDAGFGHDTVYNFSPAGANPDILQISSSVFSDWAHLLGATRQSGQDLTITLDPQNSVVLRDVSLASFTSSNAEFF